MNSVLPQFLSVSLPIIVTLVAMIWIASWSQNKRFDDLRSDINARFEALKSDMNRRFDDMNRRFDDVNHRLERIEQAR